MHFHLNRLFVLGFLGHWDFVLVFLILLFFQLCHESVDFTNHVIKGVTVEFSHLFLLGLVKDGFFQGLEVKHLEFLVAPLEHDLIKDIVLDLFTVQLVLGKGKGGNERGEHAHEHSIVLVLDGQHILHENLDHVQGHSLGQVVLVNDFVKVDVIDQLNHLTLVLEMHETLEGLSMQCPDHVEELVNAPLVDLVPLL